MYVIDLKTGGTIPFSRFESDETARAYAKYQKVSILDENGIIEGGISEKESEALINILKTIETPVETETKEKTLPKKQAKTKTK